MIVWNPDRNIFVIPHLNHPVTWYGFLFAIGFLVGFFLIRKIFAKCLEDPTKNQADIQLEAVKLTDRLTILVVILGLIGARLGHVFFYDWPNYCAHPIDIIKIWEGGLASHGGAIGILIALFIFVFVTRKSHPSFRFLTALDAIVIPVAFAGGCIRIGNFINQEITGTPTTLPWGVIFLRPLDGISGVPLHPVQLYESLFYFLVFSILFLMWQRRPTILGSGSLSGAFFLLVFGFRFLIEFVKWPQNKTFDTQHSLSVGQLLSIPFILLGLFFLVRFFYVKKRI